MIKFVRSLLGWSGTANTRTVAGNQVSLDRKEATHIQDSNTRLQQLFNLCKRYSGMPQELKFRSVYEKTKNIHTYLVARKRSSELELFHLQHTDHFINTFTVIWQVHQRPQDSLAPLPAEPSARPAEKPKSERRPEEQHNRQATVQASNGRVSLPPKEEFNTQIPRLAAPHIRINPNAKVLYNLNLQEPSGQSVLTREIGFTSPAKEKESFLDYVTARFGITNISYMGNALVNIPDTIGPSHTGLVPVIQWQSSLYALNLIDKRLFPVRFG
jgi:hypothetical protein